MREIRKGGRRYIMVDGREFSYDTTIKIYIDQETGNWVVSSPMPPEDIADILDEALEHFAEIVNAGVEDELPDVEDLGLPENVILLPMPSQDTH